MLETSRYVGALRGENMDDISARLGHSDPPTHISLFAGVGGFDLGFHKAGYDTLVAVEQDQNAADSYRLNSADWGPDNSAPVLMERDIRDVATWEILEAADIGLGECTTITGGPPCQGFSHLNTDRESGDPRNELYQEMVRIVGQAKPLTFVMENVPGLATMHDGDAIIEVCEAFRDVGYDVTWKIVDAVDYGVPQHRERVIMVGKRVDIVALPEDAPRPQVHVGAKPGSINHPEDFREKHGLKAPDQATLDAFSDDDPETLDELVEQVIQEGVA